MGRNSACDPDVTSGPKPATLRSNKPANLVASNAGPGHAATLGRLYGYEATKLTQSPDRLPQNRRPPHLKTHPYVDNRSPAGFQ